MNQIWSIVAKYGPLIVKYVSYLRYLPLLAGLIDLVRSAEGEFRAAESGAEKAAWAEDKFRSLVLLAQQAGLIKPRFANFLIERAATLVKMIVEWYKDAEGEVPPAVTDMKEAI